MNKREHKGSGRKEQEASKAVWFKAIHARINVALQPIDLAVAFALKRWVNFDNFDGFRSHEDLADDCHCSQKVIRGALARLRNDGFIEIRSGSGRGYASTFRLIKVSLQGHLFDEKGGTAKVPFAEKRYPHRAPHSKESFKSYRESPLYSPQSSQEQETGFEEFWKHYPRKKARAQALREYERAIKRGTTADDILQGVLRYAAERTGQDAQFTKHASTWLRNECWHDEADEPARPKPNPRSALAAVQRLRLITNNDENDK